MMKSGDFCHYDGDTYTCSARCVGPRVNCTILLLRAQGLHELCHLQRAVCKHAFPGELQSTVHGLRVCVDSFTAQ